MTINFGKVDANSVLYVPFHTFDSNGASITLTGLAVTDIEIYKNGSVTQRASDAGYTLLDTDGIDFDGLTGIHGFSIDLSDNTDAGFYAAGSSYWVVVSAVTVDTRTISFVAAVFSIGPISANVTQWLGTAAATPTTAGVPEVDVTDWKGATAPAMTGDAFARLGAPAGASVSADIAAIEAQTDDIGVAGAGLTAVPWNAAWDAEVQSEVQDALDATIADSIPADGTRPSISSALLMLTRFMNERSVSGTTVTVKKEDGTTSSFTLTLNDGTTPTSITRAT